MKHIRSISFAFSTIMRLILLLGTVLSASAFVTNIQRQTRFSIRLNSISTNTNPFSSLFDFFKPSSLETFDNDEQKLKSKKVIQDYINQLNDRVDPQFLGRYFTEDARMVDTAFYNPIEGKEAIIRHFYLNQGSSPLATLSKDSKDMIVVDNIAALEGKVSVLYHLEDENNGEKIQDSDSISFYTLENNLISSVYDFVEPESPKPGDSGLKLLRIVSKLIGRQTDQRNNTVAMVDSTSTNPEFKAVEKYFDAWNRRDMKAAITCFSEDVKLRDTQYTSAFGSKSELEKHLLNVADCLPGSFEFVIDDIADDGENIGVRWHVESNQKELAFTRGCSFYTLDRSTGLIKTGIEIPERAPPKPKPGPVKTIMGKFAAEPIRYIPATMWLAYMYIVFFSDDILPGANALSLEQRTWEEVRDLSINFFLVSPILNLPFAPTVHPMLEGVFNLLLAWAAMFAGFLSDERKIKPNVFDFGPAVIGMQFLTSAFLLPYLFFRTSEKNEEDIGIVYKEDISGTVQPVIAEWKPLGLFLGSVGTGSIFWAFMGRPEFGEFSERYSTFMDLLSIDRVGSSFLVDLAIFALFQGWFIDDDLLRRGVQKQEMLVLRNTAKFIPFFGLAAYLTLRPELPTRKDD